MAANAHSMPARRIVLGTMPRMASFREGSTMSIAQVAATLAHHPDIDVAFVFGSVARGEAGHDSDVDAAIRKAAPMNVDEKMQLIAELATATGRAVDVIDLRTVGEPLLGQVLKYGRMIKGEATDLATLMQQHVYAMGDFMLTSIECSKKGGARGSVDSRTQTRFTAAMSGPGTRSLPSGCHRPCGQPGPAGHRRAEPESPAQLCVDVALHTLSGMDQPVPDTMGQTFDQLAKAGRISSGLALRPRKAVGFRNVAVHSYSSIDWTVVHAIATRNLGDFHAFAGHMQPAKT